MATVNVMETAISITAVPASLIVMLIDGQPTGSILNKPSNKADSQLDSPQQTSRRPARVATRGSEAGEYSGGEAGTGEGQ